MIEDISKALLDVRRAYLFLADYQQRVVELLSFIRDEFGATDYWIEYRNSAPAKGIKRIERSNSAGKAFLPFSDISVLWIRGGNEVDPANFHLSGDLLIDVWVKSDTGSGVWGGVETPPEESQSELHIFFFLCVHPKEESHNWYHKVWKMTNYPALGEVMECEKNPGYLMYGEALSLADLTEESAVRDAISALRERASRKLNYTVQSLARPEKVSLMVI